jgi:hypothetical protein
MMQREREREKRQNYERKKKEAEQIKSCEERKRVICRDG